MNFTRLLAALFVISVFTVPVSGFAQELKVSGKVIDSKTSLPLAGATVKVKNGNASAVADENGAFTLTVPSSESIISVTYVGYKFLETKAGTSGSISILLVSLNPDLNEVIVVGYGTQKKAHLTGAVESISAKEIEDLPVSNLGAALGGRVLGLGVSGGTTRPGSAASLTIRNPMTLSKDGGTLEPLYVIDGVVQIGADGRNDNTYFNNLDPSEVESITILKDASAAVYGSRAVNGVLLVTTKRGKAGKPRVSYSGSYGWNDEAYRTKMLSAYDFARYMNIMNGPNGANAAANSKTSFFSDDELEHFKTINHDWLEPVWHSANNTRHTLNVSGGADRATYFAGASFYDQTGNLSTLDYKRWTFRAGADVKILNGFKAGLQVAGNYSNKDKTFNKIGGENDENDYRNLLLAPRYIPAYVNGVPVRLPGTNALAQYHFYEIERLGNLASNQDRFFNVNMYAEYEVPFIKGLKARASYARNYGFSKGSQIGTRYELSQFSLLGANNHIYDGASVLTTSTFKNGDRLYYSNSNTENIQSNFTLNYARRFGRHNVSALFSVEKAEAFSSQEDVWKEAPLLSTNGQFTSAFGAIDGRTSAAESGALGYIGRVNYDYSDKYLFEFLFRTDASTKFAPENYWGRFYSGSAGWVISSEDFFNVSGIDFLKLRYSLGVLGKDDTKPWQWRQRYTYQNGKGAVFGGNAATSTGMKMEASPNRDATWSNELKNNLGIDARFLQNRLSLTLEGFYNHGTDMLIERTATVPVTVGGSLAAENYAVVNFFGYEMGLGWRGQVGKDFNYGIDARFNWYDNKVIQGNFGASDHLYPWRNQAGQSTDNGAWGYEYLGMFQTQTDIDNYVSKYNITSMFGTAASNFKPGMLYYRDVRGALQPDGTFAGPDGKIDDNDQVQLAKKVDNHYGLGMTFRAGYKGISLDMVVSGSFGGWSEFDNTSRKKLNNNIDRNFQSLPAYWGDIYDPVLNPAGKYPNPHWDAISLSPRSDFWQVSGFRMRMRNINLNYTLPARLLEPLQISNARLNFTALNPVNFFNPFDYKDAEGAYDIFPTLRTYSVGVNVSL